MRAMKLRESLVGRRRLLYYTHPFSHASLFSRIASHSSSSSSAPLLLRRRFSFSTRRFLHVCAPPRIFLAFTRDFPSLPPLLRLLAATRVRLREKGISPFYFFSRRFDSRANSRSTDSRPTYLPYFADSIALPRGGAGENRGEPGRAGESRGEPGRATEKENRIVLPVPFLSLSVRLSSSSSFFPPFLFFSRRMFPTCRVSFNGLKSEGRYAVLMDIVPVDNKRYRYAYHRSCWLVAGKADPPAPPRLYVHPDSPFTGDQLRKQVVSFEKVKLTNNDMDKHGQVRKFSRLDRS